MKAFPSRRFGFIDLERTNLQGEGVDPVKLSTRIARGFSYLMLLSLPAWGTPSPNPMGLMPGALEFTVPSFAGHVRGSYQDIKFGSLLFDSGPNPTEETVLKEARAWVFQAEAGTITVGSASFAATCIRVTRFNVHNPQQEFYYEFRVSALEESCALKSMDRLVEVTLVMSDFVVKRFETGTARFYGQSTNLLLFSQVLRAPKAVDAVLTDGNFFLTGTLEELPFVSNFHLEVMLRPKGQMRCDKKGFAPEKDLYSSVLVLPDPKGKWATMVPNLGGGVCLRLVGGGWVSPVAGATLPKP